MTPPSPSPEPASLGVTHVYEDERPPDCLVFPRALVGKRVDADVLPAPIRIARHVPPEQRLGALFPCADVRHAGLVVSRTERVRVFAPRASRIQRYREGPAHAASLHER